MLDDIAAELAGVRLPLATYRVQLHKGFGFNAAASIAEYLDELGVTDLYTSPFLRAAPGSNHGYDVLDHQQLNPELGTPADHAAMCSAVREKGLGHLLDIVPNHMGIGSGNSLWMDLLENGPSARAARYFDVEWHPVKEELANKVLVPILGDRYGAVLERGELKLRLLNGAFQATYFDHVFPLSPRSYGEILAYRLDELESRLPPGDASLDELKSILTAIDHLPTRHEQDPDRLEERRREKEVIKRRVAALCATDSRLREHLEQNVALYNGEPGKPRSFDRLDKLLGAQAYRLAPPRAGSPANRHPPVSCHTSLAPHPPVLRHQLARRHPRRVSHRVRGGPPHSAAAPRPGRGDRFSRRPSGRPRLSDPLFPPAAGLPHPRARACHGRGEGSPLARDRARRPR